MCLLEWLQEYDFHIEYLPGTKNFIQDALSRRPDYKDPPLQTSSLEPPAITMEEVAHLDVTLDLFTLITVDADGWLQEV